VIGDRRAAGRPGEATAALPTASRGPLRRRRRPMAQLDRAPTRRRPRDRHRGSHGGRRGGRYHRRGGLGRGHPLPGARIRPWGRARDGALALAIGSHTDRRPHPSPTRASRPR